LAEEVISTVRTAQAFGTQHTLSSHYEGHIVKARDLDIKSAMWRGGALGVFFFIIYGAYGLGMFLPFEIGKIFVEYTTSFQFWNHPHQ